MNYLKLFEDYFDKLFKYLDKYEYREIELKEGLYNPIRKQVMLGESTIKSINDFRSKLLSMTKLLKNRVLFIRKKNYPPYGVRMWFSYSSTIFWMSITKYENDFYIVRLQIKDTYKMKFYECNEFGGLLKFLKETIEGINNGTIKIEDIECRI